MNMLIDLQPTDISRSDGSIVFYFGVKANQIKELPDNAEFSVVHSPIDGYGWEFVRYQKFATRYGIRVIERYGLKPDEIAHYERLVVS